MKSPEPQRPFHNTRASRWFGVATVIFTVGILGGAAVFVVTDHPYRAVLTMGAGLLLLGLLRGAWPGHPWFGSRNRWLDVLAYWIVGGGLIWLAPWVALIPG